jgi:hypothetical protein
MNTSATHVQSPRGLRRGLPLALIFLMPFFLVACEIVEVDQPSEAVQGELIEVNVTIGLYEDDENPWHGVLSVMVPEDWEYEGGEYFGPLGEGALEFSQAWTDSTNIVVPPAEGYKWIGTISEFAHAVVDAPTFMEAVLNLRVGQTTGEFGLSYFFTSNAFDTEDITFSESGDYDDNTADLVEDVPITVNPSTSGEGGPDRTAFTLEPNFPNPFRSGTQVAYEIDQAAHVRVAVYDIAGRQVAVIDEGFRTAGAHSAAFDASVLPAGVYVYRLEVDGATVQTRRMTRLR